MKAFSAVTVDPAKACRAITFFTLVLSVMRRSCGEVIKYRTSKDVKWRTDRVSFRSSVVTCTEGQGNGRDDTKLEAEGTQGCGDFREQLRGVDILVCEKSEDE
jgi:hypothetical protein